MPELTALMSAGVAHSIVPADPKNLEIWAQNYGNTVWTELSPFLKAIQKAGLDQNAENGLLKSMFQGSYVNALSAPLSAVAGPEVPFAANFLVNLVVGALSSWASAHDPTEFGGLGEILKDRNVVSDVLTFNNLIDVKAGQFALIAQLLSQGQIRDPNTHKPLALTNDSKENARLINQIAYRPENYKLYNPSGTEPTDDSYLISVGSLIAKFEYNAGEVDSKVKDLLAK